MTENRGVFCEHCYLKSNPDVAQAAADGRLKSAFDHWLMYGFAESREGVPCRCELSLPTRTRLSKQYVRGSGIEIGALHGPLPVGPGVDVKYVDRLPVDQLRAHYPELAGVQFVDVDIIDDGETLSTIPDSSVDFIIANHMLEHCENPLGTLRSHLGKLKDGAVLYLSIPNKWGCPDRFRPLTTFDHLTRDDRDGPQVSRRTHFLEWVRFWQQAPTPELVMEGTNVLERQGYSIHFHVWDEISFREFLVNAREYLGNAFQIVEFVPHRNSHADEIITVLRKVTAADR